MSHPRRIVVFHTAFIGDIILALPLVQVLHSRWPDAWLTFVAIPAAAGVLKNHPSINEVVVYDKKGKEKGFAAFLSLSRRLRDAAFDVALVPHRSLRSAVAITMARIPVRVGFSTSAGRVFLTDLVPYRNEAHEIARNLDLLQPLGIQAPPQELPALFPDREDVAVVGELMRQYEDRSPAIRPVHRIALAPGSVWNTKRWPEEYFVSLARKLVASGDGVVLIGGADDRSLCSRIEAGVQSALLLNAAGALSLLQSAELIRRCALIVTNDSAPMHLAVGMRIPVVAIFGATVPAFGFAPQGPRDQVVETSGLPCRPCSIHGGSSCPIKTFDCMNRISPESLLEKIRIITQRIQTKT
jgi:heptosyltransferase-2